MDAAMLGPGRQAGNSTPEVLIRKPSFKQRVKRGDRSRYGGRKGRDGRRASTLSVTVNIPAPYDDILRAMVAYMPLAAGARGGPSPHTLVLDAFFTWAHDWMVDVTGMTPGEFFDRIRKGEQFTWHVDREGKVLFVQVPHVVM